MLDYLDLGSDLDEEARLVRGTARRFVDERVRPDIADHFEAGTFPESLIPEMGELGFFGPNLEAEGLDGIGPLAYGALMQELEAGDSAVRSMASVQGALVMFPIATYGSEAQRRRWLDDLAGGEVVGCFGLTEPEHGSDPAGMTTRAEPDGDGYVLTGEKTWITNAPIADLMLIWARDHAEDGQPVRGFLVPADAPGVSTAPIEGKLSMRASSTGSIRLDGVEVGASAVLPGVEGLAGPLSCLTEARFGIVWGATGAARDCFEAALDYAGERTQFGGPIARFQLQQEKLAEMATGVTAGQLFAHRLARLKARGELRPPQVSMAKRYAVRMARGVTRTAREMLGGNGITTDYPPMRHLANMETVYTYEGTHDIHSLIVGEDLTGIGAYA